MNTELTNKLLKYLGQGIVIYLLFKYVPKEPMPNKDIILITIIVILAYAVFENLHALYYKNDSELLSQTQCNTKCTIKNNTPSKSLEHMGNLPTPTAATAVVSNSTEEEEEEDEDEEEEEVVVPVMPAVPVMPVMPAMSVMPEMPAMPVMPAMPAIQPPNEMIIKAENLEKQREKDLTDIKAAPINSGVYANPEIIQGGIKRNPDGSFTIIPNKNPQTQGSGSRATNDVMGSEMPYNYTDYNTLPIPTTWDSYEEGSSFLPPAQWFPIPPHPPVCVQEKQCPVCPVYTSGTEVTLKDWNQTRRIMPPDNINVKYVQDKLNSGR